MLKRMLCILIALTMVTAAIAGCAGDNAANNQQGGSQQETNQQPTDGGGVPEPGSPAAETGGSSIIRDSDRVAGIIGNRTLAPLSAASQNRVVNLGYYNCDHMTAAPIGKDSGIYEALGLTVNVTGNGRVPEAMSAGHMDMGYVNHDLTISARLGGTPLFIAGENHSGGSIYLVASNDIRTPQDLVGKRIAIVGNPMEHLNWLEWTAQLGIPTDINEYENFVMSDAEKYWALKAGRLDAFHACDPWASMAEYEGTGWVMIGQNTDRPGGHGTCCKVVMHTDFAAEFPDLAERMLLAHTLSIQFMYLHPYRAAQIFSRNFQIPFEVGLMTMYKKLVAEGRTIRWDLNMEYYQNQINTFREYGIRNDINTANIADFVDLTYFNNSGADDFMTFIREQVDPIFPIGMSYEEFRAKAVEVDGINE